MGVFDGSLGVAWPFMRTDLQQPLAGLGLLLIVSTVGFLIVNLLVDQILDRIGLRGALAAGTALFAVAMLAIGAGPWPVVVAGAIAWGVATGFVNAGINLFSAAVMSGSTIQVLHGLWGVGTLVGPLLVTGSVLLGHGWRPPVLLVAAGELALFGWVLAAPAWPDPRGSERGTSRGPVTAAMLLAATAFFLYTAAEWTGGQWSFTVLTESRGFSTASAGLLISFYWAGLTAGRLLSGAVGLRLPSESLLAGGLALAVLAAAAFWLAPGLSAVALPLLGFGLAPVYPALMKLTQKRVPAQSLGMAVGLQTAAGGVGAAVTPAAAGLALQRFGLPMLGPMIFGLTLATAAVGALLETRSIELFESARVRSRRRSN